MARDQKEEAEKACQRAEELFLAGNIRGAHRQATRAGRLCPSLPGVANALAAYEVHAAAGAGWRAVLGIRPGAAATPGAVKKQYRRLSLLVHPDKARCAAAEEAFKLVRQACEKAFSTATSCRDTAAATYAPRADAAAPPPPPMFYCLFCKSVVAGKVGVLEQQAGIKCGRCHEWLCPPWQEKPPAPKEPPAAPGRQVFECPASCPECGAAYTSKVCVGRWCLRCKACTKSSMVDVQGPDKATATVQRRPGR